MEREREREKERERERERERSKWYLLKLWVESLKERKIVATAKSKKT